MTRVLPIKWAEGKALGGGVSLTGLDGIINVYDNGDGSWRIYADGFYEDFRNARDIASREEAVAAANAWWAEYLSDKIT